MPPLYLQWLFETEGFHYIKGEEYVRQCFNGNQGTKPASRIWYDILVKVLTEYGFKISTVDQGLFVKPISPNKWFYVLLATDDLLCSYPTDKDFHDLQRFLKKYFNLS